MELDNVTLMPCEVTCGLRVRVRIMSWPLGAVKERNAVIGRLLTHYWNSLGTCFSCHWASYFTLCVPPASKFLIEPSHSASALHCRLGAKIDGLQLTMARLWSGALHGQGPRFACQLRIRKHTVQCIYTNNLAHIYFPPFCCRWRWGGYVPKHFCPPTQN